MSEHLKQPRVWFFYGVLSAVTLGTCWPVVRYELVNYDDDYVTANSHVREGLTLDGVRWAFTTIGVHNWHPVTWLSHMFDCQGFGLNAGAHHLVNVLFHIGNTLLLFIVLLKNDGWAVVERVRIDAVCTAFAARGIGGA
jgi:hypothetical protein